MRDDAAPLTHQPCTPAARLNVITQERGAHQQSRCQLRALSLGSGPAGSYLAVRDVLVRERADHLSECSCDPNAARVVPGV